MNRIVIATAVLAVGVASAANAYYVDMGGWSTWSVPASYMNITYGDVAVAPDTIEGNNYGSFSVVHPPDGSGDYGNIYMPLTTQSDWAVGHTYAISFDIKILDMAGYVLCSSFYTRPQPSLDGSWGTPILDMGLLDDGQWHRVTLTIDMPEGYNWTPASPHPGAEALTSQGEHDFEVFNQVKIAIFRIGGGYGNPDHHLSWLADNISIMDLTAGIEYAANGGFDDLNKDGTPVGYTFTGTGVAIAPVQVGVPEPMTMTLLTLGGLALLRRRR